jgi:hypothetical protein
MNVQYLIVGAALIVGGVLQRKVHRDLSPRHQEQVGLAGRWSGILGFVAVGLGVVMVIAGFVTG